MTILIIIIIHYQVIQDPKNCNNNTITENIYVSEPKNRPGLQKEPKASKRTAKPGLKDYQTHQRIQKA